MKIFSAFKDVQHYAIDIARKLDVIDTHHFHHSINVCLIAMSMGLCNGFNRGQLEEIGLAAMLHDIGKIKIPHSIWTMPNKPDLDEWTLIKKHSMIGYEMVNDLDMPRNVCLGVLQHHERLDGTGYPFGVKGDNICEYGKIIAIADVYDAMRSKRSYKEMSSRDDAFNFLVNSTGSHFDPDLMAIFKRSHDRQVV